MMPTNPKLMPTTLPALLPSIALVSGGGVPDAAGAAVLVGATVVVVVVLTGVDPGSEVSSR